MSEPVDADTIEGIVGVTRHATEHIARAVSAEERVYILHPHACLAVHDDLRQCPWSRALDNGVNIEPDGWVEDTPQTVVVADGALMPQAEVTRRLREAL